MAQLNSAELQNPHYGFNGSRYMPTQLGDGFKHVEVELIHPYIGVGNNFVSISDVKGLAKMTVINTGLIDGTIGKLQKDNIVYVGADISLLSFGFNVLHKDKQPFLSFSFGIREKMDADFLFNGNIFSLLYKGNKQYAGTTINLAPSFNLLAYRDYALGAAVNIKLPAMGKLDHFIIKPAVRLRYLAGQASIYMPNNQLTMLTHADGRAIDFGFNYDIYASTPVDTLTLSNSFTNVSKKDISKGITGKVGNGVALDWGVRISPIENLAFNIGMIDMGKIKFKKNTVSLSNHSEYTFDGYEMNFGNQQSNQSQQLDSVLGILKPTIAYGSYSVPLGSKLIFSGNYFIGKKDRKGTPFYKHQINLLYAQGFSNYLSSTKKPFFSVGYLYSIANVLNLGTNISTGGLTKFALGFQLTLKVLAVKVGINTNNIIPIVTGGGSGRGTDIGLLASMVF